MRKQIADSLISKVEGDYNEIALEFNQTRSNPWYEFEIYRELVKRGDKVLDLGCGNGRLFTQLEDFEISYVGVDVSTKLLDKAKFKFRNKKSLSTLQFKKGSFLDIPYKRPTFDKIFCVASFHHIPSREYRLQALANMKNILKKDGLIAISVWNLWQKKYRPFIWKSILRMYKYDFADCFIPWSKTGVMRYYHAFSVFEMRHLLREAGYFIVEEVMVTKGAVTENFGEAENLIFIIRPIHEDN